MEETPENGKELSHSVHVIGMNECILIQIYLLLVWPTFLIHSVCINSDGERERERERERVG
jgi:hypothetical protein